MLCTTDNLTLYKAFYFSESDQSILAPFPHQSEFIRVTLQFIDPVFFHSASRCLLRHQLVELHNMKCGHQIVFIGNSHKSVYQISLTGTSLGLTSAGTGGQKTQRLVLDTTLKRNNSIIQSSSNTSSNSSVLPDPQIAGVGQTKQIVIKCKDLLELWNTPLDKYHYL